MQVSECGRRLNNIGYGPDCSNEKIRHKRDSITMTRNLGYLFRNKTVARSATLRGIWSGGTRKHGWWRERMKRWTRTKQHRVPLSTKRPEPTDAAWSSVMKRHRILIVPRGVESGYVCLPDLGFRQPLPLTTGVMERLGSPIPCWSGRRTRSGR